MTVNKAILALALGLALASCKNSPDDAKPVEQSQQTASNDAWADAPSTPVVNEPTAAPASMGKLEPFDTDNDTDSRQYVVTGTNNQNNDDSNITDVLQNHLYSSHDKYHQVTCWYMKSPDSTWALSCLPDSQVANPEE